MHIFCELGRQRTKLYWDRDLKGTGTASEVCVKSGQRGDVYIFL